MAKLPSRSNAAPTLAGGASALAAGAALAGLAVYNKLTGDKAERQHPPRGRFATIDGVRVHYLEAGSGPTIVLLHGNGAMAEDFVVSGLFRRLTEHYHVIAPDRPGFGYTERPRGRIWTPIAQAALMTGLLDELGVKHPIVLGHSWGTLVALAMAMEPGADLRGLMLLAGYYYPTARPALLVLSAPAIPVAGDVMRYTVSPIFSRAMLPLLRKRIFSPRAVPARFRVDFPMGLSLRPWQLRASAEDIAFMIPAVAAMQKRYAGLDLPVIIIAGDGDRIVTPADHSERLHREIPGSELRVLPGLGHMLHYAAGGPIKQAVDMLMRR